MGLPPSLRQHSQLSATAIAEFQGGRYRISSLPSQFSSESHIQPPSQRRMDFHDVKVALAELYAACHRGMSIGDMWVALACGDLPPGMPATVNWKKMFQLIDHRRFATFGQVHGLLQRVHDYPLIIDRDNILLAEKVASSLSLLTNPVPKQGMTGALERGRSLNSSKSDPAATGRVGQALRRNRAMHMDGRHCDDELVCIFGQPYADILDLFPDNEIIHVFATE